VSTAAPTKAPTRAPERAPAKPAPGASHSSGTNAHKEARPLGVSSGPMQGVGDRIGIYGPGGIGKTELVASLTDVGIQPYFIDLDCGTLGLDVSRAMCGDCLVQTFEDVRDTLHSYDMLDPFGAVAIDTMTVLEERASSWVIENIPHEKGKPIQRIDDYGFGKGYTHIFEAVTLVLQDLDTLCRRGKHAIVVCHQCAEKAPSAQSDDYLEYQPRLQSPPKMGKVRERVFEWTNHFFRIDHDRFVKDGKAKAGDVRTIHTVRSTTFWAKHRTLSHGTELPDTIPFLKGDASLWKLLFNKE